MTALILDDEKQSRNLIRQYLLVQFPQMIVEEIATVAEGKTVLKNKHYDLLFLDIHLGGGTSFDILDEIKTTRSQIIFITAHSEFAIKAFKYSAIDYLIKPIDPDEFHQAVLKAMQNSGMNTAESIQHFQSQIKSSAALKEKLVIPTMEGFHLTSITNILYCKANGNYTEIVLEENKKIVSSYTLGHFDELLTSHGFLRIHRSFLINMNKVSSYKRGEGGSVIMENGDELDVSRANKELLLRQLKS